MSFSTYAENAVLNHLLGGPDYSRPGTVYLAACTSAPTDDVAGAEPSIGLATGYARVAIPNDSAHFPQSAGGTKTNGLSIAFPQANAAWGLVTHFEVYDAPSAGNRICYGPAVVAKTVAMGDVLEVAVNGFILTLD